MLFVNYNGLTYRWNGEVGVEVLDGKVVVDHFTLGGYEATYSDFIAGIVKWDDYMNDWRQYGDTEDTLSDVEADAMTLASAGMGTDEDYGYFGDEY